jgi:hypothetical protein
MTIEQPTFPTPEDERRAALLYKAVSELAEIHNDIPVTAVPGMKKPAEAGHCEDHASGQR